MRERGWLILDSLFFSIFQKHDSVFASEKSKNTKYHGTEKLYI